MHLLLFLLPIDGLSYTGNMSLGLANNFGALRQGQRFIYKGQVPPSHSHTRASAI